MTEDLISCSNQSLVGTNLCEARTKKSSADGCEEITLDLGKCLVVGYWNVDVLHYGLNYKLKGLRHAPWEFRLGSITKTNNFLWFGRLTIKTGENPFGKLRTSLGDGDGLGA